MTKYIYLDLCSPCLYIKKGESADSLDEEHSLFHGHAPIFSVYLNYWHCPSVQADSADTVFCAHAFFRQTNVHFYHILISELELMCKQCHLIVRIFVPFCTLISRLVTNTVKSRQNLSSVISRNDLLLSSRLIYCWLLSLPRDRWPCASDRTLMKEQMLWRMTKYHLKVNTIKIQPYIPSLMWTSWRKLSWSFISEAFKYICSRTL